LVAQLQRVTARDFYGDYGYIIKAVKAGTFDAYNHPVTTDTSIPVECSFTDRPSTEIWKEHLDLSIIQGEARFTSQTPPDKGDKFKIVGRFGSQNYPDKTYEIVGIVNRDAFGYVVALKAVEV
jgi:hypothetical protein